MGIILISNFTACNSTKAGFVKNPPFKITESYVQDWVGGQSGVSGTNVVLKLNSISKDVSPDSLYYKNEVVVIDQKITENQETWVGFFNNKKEIRDIQFSSKPEEEYVNKVPIRFNNHFNLSEDEVVLVFTDTQGKHYFKIRNIEKRPIQSYPIPPPKP